jgi:hypothetical protein
MQTVGKSLLRLLLLAGLSAVALLAQQAKRYTVVPDKAKQDFTTEPRIAIVAGVNDYQADTGFGPLSFAVDDARQIARMLGKFGYTVRLLTNAEVTKARLLKTIADAHDLIGGRGGSILFFFSGHGFESKGGKNYLATMAVMPPDLERNGIMIPEIEEALARTGAQRRVLWLDACRNDPEVGARAFLSQRTFSRLAAGAGDRILYATAAGSVSYESKELRHGVFTYYLIEGLAGKAAGSDGLILFDDLADYVTEKVTAWAFSQDVWKKQKPYCAGQYTGPFLIAATKPGVIPEDPASGGGVPSSPVQPKGLTDRMLTLKSRVAAGGRALDQLSSQLESDHLSPAAELLVARDSAETFLSEAQSEASAGRFDDASKSLDTVQQAVEKLEKRLGIVPRN